MNIQQLNEYEVQDSLNNISVSWDDYLTEGADDIKLSYTSKLLKLFLLGIYVLVLNAPVLNAPHQAKQNHPVWRVTQRRDISIMHLRRT
ncbi:hypothetical protein KAU11_09635 [Candidatus Babeliales bacterium]|nr:hypothetical protein [Candidatus Babeliales bacterium]